MYLGLFFISRVMTLFNVGKIFLSYFTLLLLFDLPSFFSETPITYMLDHFSFFFTYVTRIFLLSLLFSNKFWNIFTFALHNTDLISGGLKYTLWCLNNDIKSVIITIGFLNSLLILLFRSLHAPQQASFSYQIFIYCFTILFIIPYYI